MPNCTDCNDTLDDAKEYFWNMQPMCADCFDRRTLTATEGGFMTIEEYSSLDIPIDGTIGKYFGINHAPPECY